MNTPNPAALMKLMGAKKKFEDNHPKFVAFFKTAIRQGINEGDVIEISITHPDGTKLESNLKVQQSDLDLVSELRNMMN